MSTVTENIYFAIHGDIQDLIETLIGVEKRAIDAGMIIGTGKVSIHSSSDSAYDDNGSGRFEFERPETEKERAQRKEFDEFLTREEFEAFVKAAKDKAAKALEDKERWYGNGMFDGYYPPTVKIYGSDGDLIKEITCRSNDHAKELRDELNKHTIPIPTLDSQV